MEAIQSNDFGRHLRHWRGVAKVSQMKLALTVELSPKHLNQLENGKSNPTRDVVLKVSSALGLSLKNTNNMLLAAGFSPEPQQSALSVTATANVDMAVDLILAHQEPYPAVVADSLGDVIKMNAAAVKMIAAVVGGTSFPRYRNVYELFFADDGFKPYVENWEEASLMMLHHLQQEVLAMPPGNRGHALLAQLQRQGGLPEDWRQLSMQAGDSPMFFFKIKKGDLALEFFSTYQTFGSPRDTGFKNIRIECFFPGDEATKRFCEAE